MMIRMAGGLVFVHRLKMCAFGLITGLMLVACGSSEQAVQDEVLATVGDRVITAASFRRAYLPRILYRAGDDNAERRSALLQELIDEKILAQAAANLHFDTAYVVKRAAGIAQRQAMAALLYRDWVQQRLPAPTEDDLWTAFVRGQTKLLVRHLAVDTKAAADSLRGLLISGWATFGELAGGIFNDPRLRDSGGLLGWVTYGDLDEKLEDAIFNLRPGEVSKPIKSLYGWHILKVDDARRSAAFDRQEFERQRDNLETKVYRRQELRLGTKILNDYMREHKVDFDRKVAGSLWDILEPQLRSLKQNNLIIPEGPLQVSSRNYGIEETAFLNKVLVRFEGGSWTVQMLLHRLPEMQQKYLVGNLYTGTAYLIRDELLAREGLARKYDRDPDVIRRIRDRKDEVLAQLYMEAILDTVTITRQMVRQFYNDHWQQRYYGPDSLHMQAIIAGNQLTADRQMLDLRQGASFDEIMHQSGGEAGIEGDLGWQVRDHTLYPVLYSRGLRTKIMVPIGPIKTIDGWLIARVTDRRRYPVPFEDMRDQVRNDLERELVDMTRRQVVDNLAPHVNIVVDEDRLHSLWRNKGSS